MRIKTFYKFLAASEVTERKLRNEPVVIDGHNFFFRTYEDSEFDYILGCECDRYTEYLRKLLDMFHKADIKCYFLFKGGFQDFQKRFNRKDHPPTANRKRPYFTKNVIMDVMKESEFEYVVCQYEAKKDVIELAQKLKCPIISFDVEYCFSGVECIPMPSNDIPTTFKFNESDNTIDCGVFSLQDFLIKYNLTKKKLATFIVLTDNLIYPKKYFRDFFTFILEKPDCEPYERYSSLLKWLSKNSSNQILEAIFPSDEKRTNIVSAKKKKKFVEEVKKARKMIRRRESGGLGAACLLDRDAGRVARADPRWFAKGVAAGHVATEYVNLYRDKVFYGANPIPGFDNPMLVSLDIIYYAYDLLTDFKNDGFNLIYENHPEDKKKQIVKVTRTRGIPKPAYEAEVCVFENGWDSVASLGLLEHFARSALQLASLRRLERAPAPARLLLLALAYCSRRRPAAPAALPAAVLLTHVILDLRADRQHNNLPEFPFERQPILESTTDRSRVTYVDCGIAAAIIEQYFKRSEETDVSLLHPLVEWQQCVLQLSALNALCGAELRAPVLARTYNGTLAYNLLRAAERATDQITFLDELLSPAPTVYAYYKGLYEVYEDLSA